MPAVMLDRLFDIINKGAGHAHSSPQLARSLKLLCYQLAAAMQDVFRLLEMCATDDQAGSEVLGQLMFTVQSLWRLINEQLEVWLTDLICSVVAILTLSCHIACHPQAPTTCDDTAV